MDALTLFGVLAVTAMLIFYALEDRSPWFILAFAGACALGSAYGFLQGAWPFGVVEAIWAGVAVLRWRTRMKNAERLHECIVLRPSRRPAPRERKLPARPVGCARHQRGDVLPLRSFQASRRVRRPCKPMPSTSLAMPETTQSVSLWWAWRFAIGLWLLFSRGRPWACWACG